MLDFVHIDMKQRRVWVFGRRLHHGAAGVVLGMVGVALAIHDSRDWRHWF